VNGQPSLETVAGSGILRASGAWTAHHAAALEARVDQIVASWDRPGVVEVDVSQLTRLDTFGAWLLERLVRGLRARGLGADLKGLAADDQGLFGEVHQVPADADAPAPRSGGLTLMLATIGHAINDVGLTLVRIVNMLGRLVVALGHTLRHPASFRLTATVHQLEQVGWRAVPIIVLITFLVGCIIGQQGIFHFRKFGADIFVVDMVGVLVLRELGVLLVAIMVAGRSGSAYTAELGSMKMREEIDALRTMGFDPIEVLVLPRILALIIAVPILTFVGSMAAMYGGGLTAWLYGGIQPDIFLSRLREAISLDHFKIGLIKAPFMAIAIGVIAAVEGMNVRGSAESLGQHTTASVVKAIFFVIVLDGAFAVFFASIGM